MIHCGRHHLSGEEQGTAIHRNSTRQHSTAQHSTAQNKDSRTTARQANSTTAGCPFQPSARAVEQAGGQSGRRASLVWLLVWQAPRTRDASCRRLGLRGRVLKMRHRQALNSLGRSLVLVAFASFSASCTPHLALMHTRCALWGRHLAFFVRFISVDLPAARPASLHSLTHACKP
jgi:hypothetical protein